MIRLFFFLEKKTDFVPTRSVCHCGEMIGPGPVDAGNISLGPGAWIVIA